MNSKQIHSLEEAIKLLKEFSNQQSNNGCNDHSIENSKLNREIYKKHCLDKDDDEAVDAFKEEIKAAPKTLFVFDWMWTLAISKELENILKQNK